MLWCSPRRVTDLNNTKCLVVIWTVIVLWSFGTKTQLSIFLQLRLKLLLTTESMKMITNLRVIKLKITSRDTLKKIT
jgi:hypothetical protein